MMDSLKKTEIRTSVTYWLQALQRAICCRWDHYIDLGGLDNDLGGIDNGLACQKW